MHLNKSLPPHSRVWVFQSKDNLDEHNAYLHKELTQFVNQWQSHGKQVSGDYEIVLSHFIIIAADESVASVSGCSIDSVVALMKHLSSSLSVDFFDRQTVFYKEAGALKSFGLHELGDKIQRGVLTDESLMVNTLIKDIEEFETIWLKPLKNSWHKRMAL